MKFISHLRLSALFVVTIFTLLNISGCSLIRTSQEIKEIESAVSITGKTQNAKNPDIPIVIGLFTKLSKDKYKLEQSTVVYGNSEFSFLTDPGDYYIGAFSDTNQDFTLQKNEHATWYGKPSALKVSSGKTVTTLTLTLKPPAQIIKDFPKFYDSADTQAVALDNDKNLGRKISLSDPIIAHSVGKMGQWHPVDFVEQHKHGIFILQDYDPKKIPVLFVHGIGGSGSDLATLISNIDKQKYQPWIIQYPSGLRLDLIASHFSGDINKLRSKYGFDKYVVIAHSMGGLVSRKMIQYQITQKRAVEIPVFISISTPWNGHKAASWGVESAPITLPVWFDIVPGSPFLKTLHQQISKNTIKHHLLFSYKGRLSLVNQDNNDGVVDLSSELHPNIQAYAEEIYGFNEDHVSILKSKALLEKVNKILAEITL